MDELHRQWGTNLAFHMKARDYTQSSLADALDVSQSTVNRWLHGRCGPSDRHKLKIARLMGAPIGTLFPMVPVSV